MKDRYKRIIDLGWDLEVLKNSKALVIGAGALGNEVIKNLTLLGFGFIIVIDMDKIENHNLTRAILCREKDIGKFKSEVVAQMVKEIDPSVKVKPLVGTVQDTIGLGVFREVDIVFGCLDNIQTRIDVNKCCLQTDTPYIDGGLKGIDGGVKIFGPPYNVCFDCITNDSLRNEAWKRFSCLKLRTRDDSGFEPTGPTSPTISSIIAGFQVQIAIRYLHGIQIPVDKKLSIFGNIDDFGLFQLFKKDECPTHNNYDRIPENEIVGINRRSSEMTVGDLVEVVQKDMGNSATIDLDYDLITHVSCKKHKINKPILKKRGSLFVDEVECPECKKEGKKDNDLLMRQNFINQIDRCVNFLNLTLKEIGTPLYHIFEAKNFVDEKYVYKYYEINGDKELFFN